jgi:hypothetical protein
MRFYWVWRFYGGFVVSMSGFVNSMVVCRSMSGVVDSMGFADSTSGFVGSMRGFVDSIGVGRFYAWVCRFYGGL